MSGRGIVAAIGTALYWATRALVRAEDWKGRSNRVEFWAFQPLFGLFALTGFLLLDIEAGRGGSLVAMLDGGLLLLGLFNLGVILGAATALMVRRLHDAGRSGWWLVLIFVPYIATVAHLVIGLLPGSAGDNRFGPRPDR